MSAPGHLAENVLHFGRVLRRAGLPVGTDRVLTALQALQVAGLASRADFQAVLAACLVDRAEHRELFDQAFALFWRAPEFAGGGPAALAPPARNPAPSVPENQRLAAALRPNPSAPDRGEPDTDERWIETSTSWTQREVLRQADFDTMTPEEWRAARQLLVRLNLV